MRRLTSLLLCAFGAPLAAQTAVPNRATSLTFASDLSDARAVWVNPAALGLPLFASVAADVTIRTPFDDGARASQWSAAASSRGLGFAYQHDVLQPAGARDTYRIAYGRAARTTALGVAATFYRGNGSGTGWEVGFLQVLSPALRFAADLSNIGRPTVGGAPLPLALSADATWVAGGLLSLSGGIAATEDRFEEWALGATLRMGGRLPITLLARVDVPQNAGNARLNFGLGFGALDFVQVGATVPRSFERVDHLSVSGASTRLVGR